MTPSAQLLGRMFGSRQIRYKPCRLEAGYNGPGFGRVEERLCVTRSIRRASLQHGRRYSHPHFIGSRFRRLSTTIGGHISGENLVAGAAMTGLISYAATVATQKAANRCAAKARVSDRSSPSPHQC